MQQHSYEGMILMDIHFVTADLFRLDPRFDGKIEAESEGGCWFWLGAKQKSGKKKTKYYGKIWFRRKAIFVHRYVYWLFWGAIPDGMEVHHTCYKELCVNPNHLIAMTEEEHREEHDANFHRGYNASFSRSKLKQALERVI